MSNVKVTIEVIDNKSERDKLAERVEVLEKVKSLLLIPNTNIATSKQVAEFYEVTTDVLKKTISAYRDELELDGYKLKTGGDIVRSLSEKFSLREILSTPGKQTAIFNDGTQMTFANRTNALFPKRAILRVGMLLRDSEVAKEVRTQLLNIEENTATEVKTYEIDYEKELHAKLGKAITDGDFLMYEKTRKELYDYENRHVIEKAKRYDEFLDQEGLVSFDTIGRQFLNGMSARKLREELQRREILMKKKVDGAWSPNKGYEKYFVKSPYHTGWHTTWHTKANHEGLDFILNLLK